MPFRYQGQYYDEETGLSYNRFRYYDDSTGQYISQDPIGLAGNNPTLYGYVSNVNKWVDVFGYSVVDATFTINGQTFSGTNPLDRTIRNSGVNPGLSAPNANKLNMHAEIEAMTSAQDAGIIGGDGILEVKGKNMCPYCKGDVKKLATQMELDSLTIIDADGSMYIFDKDGLKPVKEGGSGYADAKVNTDLH